MEDYTRSTFRAIRDEITKAERQRRGNIFITLLIVALFAAAGVFYVKTAQPLLWSKATNYIKNVTVGGKSLETIAGTLFERADAPQEQREPPAETENKSGESGDMLLTADDLNFNYLSDPLRYDVLSSAQTFALPVVSATVTSTFGARTDPVTGEKEAGHHGIDLAASSGSSICAYTSGTVIEVGENEIYGNYAMIDHGDGLSTFYGHMSSVSVSEGDAIDAGGVIGVIGTTGKSTGVHLHFEVRLNGERVDPFPYLYEKI